MNRWLAVVALVAATSSTSIFALAQRARPPVPAAQDLPSRIAQSRIRLDIRGGRVLTTLDFTIPGSAKTRQDLDIHVAYGTPGQPTAVDAQLLATPAGYLVAPLEENGTKVQTTPSLRGPDHALIHVGRPQMAGTLVHVPAVSLAEKLTGTGQATLRIRELRNLPPPLADGTYEVVVRLGAIEDRPFVIGLLEVASDQSIDQVEARYCGLNSSTQRLFVAGQPRSNTVIPPLSQRNAGDDLCIHFGVKPDAPAPAAKK
jgi:hypothetical protein